MGFIQIWRANFGHIALEEVKHTRLIVDPNSHDAESFLSQSTSLVENVGLDACCDWDTRRLDAVNILSAEPGKRKDHTEVHRSGK